MKKSLGQNFLKSDLTAHKIVSLLDINSSSSILEIGPGNGMLTKFVSELNPKKCFLIELDNDLAHKLEEKFPNFKVFNDDAKSFDFKKYLEPDNFLVLGNLPYNVSKKILFNLIKNREYFHKMVLMFQKEVGERIIANPGDSNYGALSVLSQEFYEIKKEIILKPEDFYPKPKIDSIVLSFNRREKPLVNVEDRAKYEFILNLLFSSRRKMIRRTLRSFFNSDEEMLSVLRNLNLSETQRPQELKAEDFLNLSKKINI